MDTDPLSVFFVKSDSKGDRLLFRYPFKKNGSPGGKEVTVGLQDSRRRRTNPYSISVTENCPTLDSGGGFPDELLSNLFAVKQELCEAKFELKINNVRFVGHPTLVQPCSRSGKTPNKPIILINIVFALQAPANHSIVKCYYELSKRMGVALRHEERRNGYVNQQIKMMIAALDDRPEDADPEVNPFEVIVDQCHLAQDLRNMYNDLCNTGLVQLRVNRWVYMGFCLPQKVHQLHVKPLGICPESINKCLEGIKPYHGLLLLIEPAVLLDTLVPDASPALIRLIKIYSPLKSLQTLSADADLTLTQVFNLSSHLVYWGKAIIIYPLCESNVYMTAPNAAIHVHSHLVEKFAEQFPAQNLIQIISDFSLPTSVRQRMSPISGSTNNDVHVIIWLLQNRLLLQLHTYIYYMPTPRGVPQQDLSINGLSGAKSDASICDVSTPSETMSMSDSSSESGDEVGKRGAWETEGFLGRLAPDERNTIINTPASPQQLKLLIRLIQQNYLQGEHHMEDIMYTENLRRSQLLQLLDKFREVLITCEAEDPALALFYPHNDV